MSESLWTIAVLASPALAFYLVRALLRRTAAGFVWRHGIDVSALYVCPEDCAAGDPVVYERRVRRANIYGSSSLTRFAIPLDIEEYRRVSLSRRAQATVSVSDWFSNNREFRRDGRWALEPLMTLRPLTAHELDTFWPITVARSVASECQSRALGLPA